MGKEINVKLLLNGDTKAQLTVDGMPPKVKNPDDREWTAARLDLIINVCQGLKKKVLAGEEIPSFVPFAT